VLLDRAGKTYTSILPGEIKGQLLPGDFLRAQLSFEGHAQVFCAYPPEAAELNR
jgi:hypothetical protein